MNYSIILNPKDNIKFEIINDILILANTAIILKSVNEIFISKNNITIIYNTQIPKIYCLIQIYLNELVKFGEKLYSGIKCIYGFIINFFYKQ
jgi:hypothetical protein